MMSDDKPVRRIFLKTGGWTIFFYLLVFIPINVVEQAQLAFGSKNIHIYRDYPHSIYANTADFAAYGLNRLNNYPRQIFILGASPPGHSLLPDLLMQDVKGYEINNLCIMAANITETKEVADLIQTRVNILHLQSPVFILAEQFVSFLDNHRKFAGGLTNIEQEELRHHLYVLRDGKIVPVFHGASMDVATFMMKPFIAIYALKFRVFDMLDEARVRIANFSDRDSGRINAQEAKAIRLRQMQNEGPADDQFIQLGELVDQLTKMNATVVYVDMPVISYYRSNFPFYTQYRQKIQETMSSHPSVHYLDLTAAAADEEFSDDAHAKPEFYVLWTARISDYLRILINTHS